MNLKVNENLERKNSEENETSVIKKRVTTKDVEIWEVAGLKSNIEPCSRPSDLFERLAEKRKSRHENLLRELANKMNSINSKTENNIKMSSTDFKAHIKYFEEELNKMISSIDNPECMSQSSNDLQQFYAKANKFKLQQQRLVKELIGDLNKFEDLRAKENEELLHYTCEEMRKIGHLLPYQVQTFAEQEILKINQLSLNNRRCYNDLKLTLSLVTEQTFKGFSDKMNCTREKWARKKIEEARQKMENSAEKSMMSSAPKLYTRLELKGFELDVTTSPDDVYSECQISEWSNNMVKVANTIECHGKNVIELYKKILSAVFKDFSNEINEIIDKVNALENVDIEGRVIKPLYFEAQREQTKEIENLEVLWQDNLSEIKCITKDVIDFLQDVGKLWSRHKTRFCESKTLILKALEKDEENNSAVLQDLEIKLNIALDNLRQEFNKPKLDKAHEAAISILNTIKEKYEFIYINQVTIIEDFYKMVDLEVDVLSADIKEFVYTLHTAEVTKNTYHFCDQYNTIPNGKYICKEMQRCIHQIKAFKSWKHGVWMALEAFPSKAKECLGSRAEIWVQSKIDNLAEKTTLQLELLQKRYGRIKVEIYEKRVAEVDLHQEVLNSHIQGVKLVFSKMKEELATLSNNESSKLMILKTDFPNLEKNAKVENRPGVIKTNQIKIERKKKEFEERCKAQFAIFRADCEVKAANVEQANITYMKAIKLFSEGGDYSVEEAKTVIARLESIDKEITSELKNISKEISKEEIEILKKSAATFTPIILLLTSLYEETFFNFEVKERIREFKEKIEDHVRALRSDLNGVQELIDCMCKNIGNLEKPLGENAYEYWWYLVKLLYKNISNLFYPMKPYATPALSEQATEEEDSLNDHEETMLPCFGDTKFSVKATVSQTPTFRSTEVTDNFPCTSYKQELFKIDDPPQNDGTFMAVVSNCLWTELDYLQKLACSFYKKIHDRKIIREDLIQGSYDLFASETVPYLRSYGDQCEQVWLHTIIEFLPSIGRVKSAANCFFQRQLDDYEKEALLILQEQEKIFKNRLQTQGAKNCEIFESLDKKLLPLHGYPKNKHLLEELEEEVVKKTSGLGIEWDLSITNYKNNLKCFRIYHLKEQTDILKIQEQYFKIKENIFIDDLGNNLLDLILEYTDRGGYYTARTAKEQLIPQITCIAEEHRLNLDLKNLKTIHEYLSSLRDMLNTERSELFDDTTLGCPPCYKNSIESIVSNSGKDTSIRNMNILMPPMNSITYIQQICERMDERIRKMHNFADSMTNTHEEVLFKWLNVWKVNVKKIKKLFTIKYEEKPKVEEKVLSRGEFSLIVKLLPHYLITTP